jgi:predicted N-formylglutamate amidohydrolase
MNLVLTCEHGGNEVPPEYAHLFEHAVGPLASHRGWDPGSLAILQTIARELDVEPIVATTTRLLVDLNRSLDNPTLFSEFVPPELHEEILREYYFPYRNEAEELILRSLPTLHVSIHTFTPNLNGEIRTADVGILFDPACPREVAFAEALFPLFSPYRTRMNYPYQGIEDGLTTYLRQKFPDSEYAGIELEFSQAIAYDKEIATLASKALKEALYAL